MRKIKIGTRGSALALRQANEIAETLKASHPQFDYEIVIKSTGDKIKDRPLSKSAAAVFSPGSWKAHCSAERWISPFTA